MPLYEYICNACGRLIERYIPNINDVGEIRCDCGSDVKRVVSNSSIRFIGEGWTNPSTPTED